MRLKRQPKDRLFVDILSFAFAAWIVMNVRASAAMETFDALSFIENNTTFFSDFRELRENWFAVEEQIFGIEDIYAPVDWSAIRDSAWEVVMEHERLMVKLVRDTRLIRSKLPQGKVIQAQEVIKKILEYIDSVGLVILKLYEISEKLHRKTINPFSYTMTAYNVDINHLEKLYATFQNQGSELNELLYGS